MQGNAFREYGMSRKKKIYVPYLKGCKKTEKEQGLIYFTCLTYDTQPKRTREKIDQLCRAAGGQYEDALKEFLLKADRYKCERIAAEHYCSPNTLWACRRRFFNMW